MNFSQCNNKELLARLEKLARTERKITHLILLHINEVSRRRLFAELGFESMFSYLTKHLGYSEDSAYRRLQAARILQQIPQVAEKLEEGSITLTQLTQVQKCLREEKKSGETVNLQRTAEVIENLQNKSSFETKKILAKEFNQPLLKHEIVRPQKDDSIRLELNFTPEQMKTLEQARDLLSHVLPNGNWAELMALLAEKQVQKSLGKTRSSEKAPLQAKSLPVREVRNASEQMPQHFLVARFQKSRRKPIPITRRRELLAGANHQCQYVHPETGKRCASSYQLQVDHIRPVALGGENNIENLRILCRTHNIHAAARLGLG